MATKKSAKKAAPSKAIAKKIHDPKIVGWSDPPPSKRVGQERGTKYQGIIDELVANPGKCAQIMADANTASAEPFRKVDGIRMFTRQIDPVTKRVDIWAVYDPDGTYEVPDGTTESKPTKKAPAKKVAAKKAVAKPAAIGKKPARPKAVASK